MKFSEFRVATIPVDCVVTRDGGSVVFVVEDGLAVEHTVNLGISAEGMVEITGGITTDQEVVVSGQSLLSDGAQVRVVGSEGTGGDV